MSATFAAVPVTVCTSPECASTPMCAFIPKYHWLPFLVWCICGSRSLRVLGRGRRRDDRRIDDRAFLHEQLALAQKRPDLRKDLLGQIVRFEQVPELEQGR